MLTPIGQTLKTAREQRGLSLLDVAHVTRIPVARLHLLEQDNYAAFGSMTYARSFLRRYSQFLGIDASSILESLPGGVLGGPRDYRYLLENLGSWVAPKGTRYARLSSQATGKGRVRRSPVPAGIFIFLLALVGTGIWGKYVADDHLALEKQRALSSPLPPVVSPVTIPSSVQVNPPEGDPAAPALPAPVKILRAIPVPEDDEPAATAGNPGRVE